MKKNEKENRKRRLLLLILLLVLTISVLSFSTYAWFTVNKTVNVSDMNVQVRAVNGLEISADARDWRVRVGKTELDNSSNNNQNVLPEIFGSVSSSLQADTSTGFLKMYNGKAEPNCPGGAPTCSNPVYLLQSNLAAQIKCTDSTCAEDTQNFMAFDIYLKVESDTVLSVSKNASVSSPSNKGIENATRVAFEIQGHIDMDTYRDGADVAGVHKEGYQIIGEKKDQSKVILWEPNSIYHTDSGVRAALKYYNMSIGNRMTSGSHLDYEGIIDSFPAPSVKLDETDSTHYPAYFGSLPAAGAPSDVVFKYSDGNSFPDDEPLFDIKAGVTKVRVYYWVEGQDVDAENGATGSQMTLSLEFTIP